MKKTLVKNGQVWTENEIREVDLLIAEERIAAIQKPSALQQDIHGEFIDASGLLVLPGAIDIHAHIQDGAETFYQGSCSAAKGGVTTVVDMPPFSTVIDRQSWMERKEWGERECVTDFGLTGGIVTKMSDLDHLDELVEAGVAQFKIFMLMKPPTALLWAAVKKAAQTGLRLTVHMEEPACLGVVDWDDPLGFVKANPPAAENVAVAQVLEMARAAGAPVHVCHVSSGRTVELIQMHKAWGTEVTAETAPQYLLLNEEDYLEQGDRVIATPVLRKQEDSEMLWQGLQAGIIDCMITDHFLGALPEPGKPRPTLKDAEPGIAGLEVFYPMMLDTILREGWLGLEGLVDVMSVQPAALMGIDDRKGRIAVGMDADLVFMDIKSTWKIADLGENSRISTLPYEGRDLKVFNRRTMVRGETVWDGEKIAIQKGYGKFCASQ
jgi:dihydroorotase (multifunctional complex type)